MDPKKGIQDYKGNIVDELVEDEDFFEGVGGKKEEETTDEMFDVTEQKETGEEKKEEEQGESLSLIHI